ncbi:MAG: ATPase, T2SS/T4P/T4SS family [Bacilli bacterium]|nr:ATPase, T2SS/T4P/T4SS family [Bacilli bacterium]
MKDEITKYLEKSFVAQFFSSDISEISYNGENIYLNFINKTRKKSDLIVTKNQAYDLVKHIADLAGMNFNLAAPILDVSFGFYRLNAIHNSIAFDGDEGSVTFIIRVIFPSFRIKKNDKNLCPIIVHELISELLRQNCSIVISGVTGSGKTELQKYMLSLIPRHHRLIMIEDTPETHVKNLVKDLDISVWLAKESINKRKILKDLIRAGLRNNPDWLTISEVRGEEMIELFQTATSGISIITTIHSKSAKDVPTRMLQLMSKSEFYTKNDLKKEIRNYFNFFFHMRKTYKNGIVTRNIEEVYLTCIINEEIFEKTIYKIDENGKMIFNEIPQNIRKVLNLSDDIWGYKENKNE